MRRTGAVLVIIDALIWLYGMFVTLSNGNTDSTVAFWLIICAVHLLSGIMGFISYRGCLWGGLSLMMTLLVHFLVGSIVFQLIIGLVGGVLLMFPRRELNTSTNNNVPDKKNKQQTLYGKMITINECSKTFCIPSVGPTCYHFSALLGYAVLDYITSDHFFASSARILASGNLGNTPYIAFNPSDTSFSEGIDISIDIGTKIKLTVFSFPCARNSQKYKEILQGINQNIEILDTIMNDGRRKLIEKNNTSEPNETASSEPNAETEENQYTNPITLNPAGELKKRLMELKEVFEDGLISKEEYESKRSDILSRY